MGAQFPAVPREQNLTQCARNTLQAQELRARDMQQSFDQQPPLAAPYPPQPPLAENPGERRDGMRCLLVRHVPSWLSREEKESLFGHFGAQEVVMSNKGKMVTLGCYYVPADGVIMLI